MRKLELALSHFSCESHKKKQRCKNDVFGREVGYAFSLLPAEPVVVSVDGREDYEACFGGERQHCT